MNTQPGLDAIEVNLDGAPAGAAREKILHQLSGARLIMLGDQTLLPSAATQLSADEATRRLEQSAEMRRRIIRVCCVVMTVIVVPPCLYGAIATTESSERLLLGGVALGVGLLAAVLWNLRPMSALGSPAVTPDNAPPVGARISAEVDGLRIGETAAPWEAVQIERMDAYMESVDGQTEDSAAIRRLDLRLAGAPFTLDLWLLELGRGSRLLLAIWRAVAARAGGSG